MNIYPAIDIRGGRVVRLLYGDYNQETVFGHDPAFQAQSFFKEGATNLHIVDLDGAKEGKSINRKSVYDIIQGAPQRFIQLGGGIRDLTAIESWLDAGVNRVILGTVALENPEVVKDACKNFPGKIAVGLDAKGGMVATHGWLKESNETVFEVAKRFEGMGVSAIIFTDIGRDGALKGVNLDDTRKLSESVDIPVIASGGVGGINDLEQLVTISKLDGVIIGRALYDKKFTLGDALKVAPKITQP